MNADEIRQQAEKIAQEEQRQYCPETDEITDPELWPVLDPDALHDGLIRDFVDAATRHSEADPAAVLGTFLARLSVEVGRNPVLMIGDSRQHCNLLAAIAGPTGSGRKGTSARPIEKVFELTCETYRAAQTSPGPLSSGEGLIDAVKDPVLKWVVDNKTKQGEWVKIDPGVDDKRLFVLTEELSSALMAMAREGNTLSAIIRQLFDNGNLAPLTKSSKIKATGAHIGILGHITITELNQLLEDCQVHNGLINRFLWFLAKRQKICPFPEPMPDEKIMTFKQEIMAISDFARQTKEIRLSKQARELWGSIYPGLSESRGGYMGAILERAPALILRIAMLHALVDRYESKIEVVHLQTAVRIWQYCEASAVYIFGDREIRNPLTAKIMEMLDKKPMSLTEIYTSLGKHFESSAIQKTMKALLERNKVAVDCQKTSGRPKTIYRIVKF